MPKHKLTQEEWDQFDKMTDQDKMFETLSVLIKDNYEFTKDGHIKEINLKFEYKKVRADHLLDYYFKWDRDEVKIRCCQEFPAKKIGKILEDAVHLILYRLNCIKEQPPLEEKDLKDIPVLNHPPHQYLFTRHPAKDSNIVDFEEIKPTKNKPIAIECKNWAGYWIDRIRVNQITQRFKNYSDDYRKILLIPESPFTQEAMDQIKQNNIEIIEFSSQITYGNFQDILNELLPLIANNILNLNMKLPDVSCIWIK